MASPFFYLMAYLFFIAVWIYRSVHLMKALRLTPEVLPSSPPPAPYSQKVSVIIPMKNEEKNAEACIRHFLAQDYPNLELIAVNDNSSDQTETILRSLKIPYVNATKTPPGWTGKNFAVHCGVAKATGDWFLFTDADTRHEPSSVSASLAHARSNNLEFLTLLPRCLAESVMENLVQPSAMAFLGLWFPIEKINDPNSALYFANGQYLLIKRSLYEKIGGHEAVQGAFLEDFALMKKAKALKTRTQCALGRSIYGTRMYDSLDSIWRGWRRIYLHAFESRPFPLFLKFLSVGIFSVVPFLLFIPLILNFLQDPAAYRPSFIAAGILFFLMEVILWKTYEIICARKSYSIFHAAAAFLLALILWDATWTAVTKKQTVWR